MRSVNVLFVAVLMGCGASADDGAADSDDGVDAAANGGSAPARDGGSDAARGGGGGSSSGVGGRTGGTGGKAGGGAGGAPGSGGAVGSGGSGGLPHIVGSCSGLAPVGQWESVTPPGVELDELNGQNIYGSQSVQVNPQEPTMVYVGADKQGVYRLTDCGATWTKVNTGRNGDTLGTGAQWSMAMDPVDPQVLYAVNGYGSELGLWKTTNGGTDWDQLFPEASEVAQTVEYNFTSIVSMDPTDHRHLVVSFHASCKGAWAPSCLAESKDAGASWRLFKGPPSSNWEGAGPMVLDATTMLLALPFDGLFRTSDSGATWAKVAGGAHYQNYRSKDGTYYVASNGGGVLRSTDGATWSAIAGSANGGLQGIAGDGQSIFVSQQFGGKYFSAPEPAATPWKEISTPGRPNTGWGAYWMAYDPDHHILYASQQKGGLWRVVTY